MERMWKAILTRALWILLASSNTFMLTKRRLCSTEKERSCALSKTLIISKHHFFHPKRDTQNLAEIHSIGLQKLWLPFIIYHLAVCVSNSFEPPLICHRIHHHLLSSAHMAPDGLTLVLVRSWHNEAFRCICKQIVILQEAAMIQWVVMGCDMFFSC